MRSVPQLPNADILPQIPVPLLKWYHSHARLLPWREKPSPYRVWISEIMLQQTRVAAVMPYFERFLEALPDVSALAACEDDHLMKLWQGLGYYNRARNLKKAAQVIMDQHAGRIPDDFDVLLSLPGIGRYTAAAISSIAYGHPHPAVDGNVLRVITRLTLYAEDILRESTKRTVEMSLRAIYPPHAGGDMNQALMELGATVCLPNGLPHCARCPLQLLCLAFENSCTGQFPQKQPPKKRRIEKLTILLIEQDGNFALQKRPDQGLLASLWEFPHWEGTMKKDELLFWCRQENLHAKQINKLPASRHIFTHLEWHMCGWHIRLQSCDNFQIQETAASDTSFLTSACWASPQEIAQNYSIPSAFQTYLSLLPSLCNTVDTSQGK